MCARLLVPCLLAFLLTPLLSHAQESDFDSDGLSDLVLVDVQNNGTLSWRKFLSMTDSLSEAVVLGEVGNQLILSNWRDTTVPELGVVEFDSDLQAVRWKIRTEAAEAKELMLGRNNDYVISGADLDGSGFSDAIVARTSKGRWKWFVALDPFVTDSASTSALVFGSSAGKPFFLRTFAGRDSLAVLGPASGRFAPLRMRSLQSAKVQTVARFPAKFVGDSFSRPFPVRQANGTDILGFSQTTGGVQNLFFRRVNGRAVSKFTLDVTGDVVVGEYLPQESGQEVLVKAADASSALVLNPVTRAQTTLPVGEGIVVDSINVNKITGPTATPTPAIEPTPGCKSMRAWPTGHIYKTVGSEHFSPSDPRRYSAGLIVRMGSAEPFPTCLLVEDTQGTVLAKMGLYSRHDGWEARYYAGIGCGASTALSGSEIGALAKTNTGTRQVNINFGTVCSGPIDAARCIGSAHC